ncbi:DUF4058 family protein [Leptothoe spongobia TAU-MAC 1115]|uniref:DUF4058 family protein n=1 Tax=Leptothoe spongobia TAU-MAC 1115 TaxID=1967444 RepID=A0A947DEY1_9CYAN|nr:DUF4058 family protein [Leptothoe spongobia TAU-MAC 1115]
MLKSLIHHERASYDLRIDYSQPLPPPSFSEADQAWIASLFQSITKV